MRGRGRHDNASRVPRSSAVRVVRWSTLTEKAKWLDAAAALDALRGHVMGIASRFTQIPDAEARTRAIHRWVRDRIRYVHDWRVSTGAPGEEFADAESVVRRGFGDCDDKARLFVSLVRAAEMLRPLGVEVRVRPVFVRDPWAFVHVQAEVRWHRSDLADGAMPGGWLLAELILRDCEIGQDPDSVPRGPHGERQIA